MLSFSYMLVSIAYPFANWRILWICWESYYLTLNIFLLVLKFLQLLCQYEPESVLKFLETFDSYRVEHCLRLCQEHGIVDAASFLLERVGDVGSALLLTISSLNDKFAKLADAVGSGAASTEHFRSTKNFEEVCKYKLWMRKCLGISLASLLYACILAVSFGLWYFILQVKEIESILNACIGLCQRNTPRLNPDESEMLWFRLLDSYVQHLYPVSCYFFLVKLLVNTFICVSVSVYLFRRHSL